jgi:hypothetical protein
MTRNNLIGWFHGLGESGVLMMNLDLFKKEDGSRDR